MSVNTLVKDGLLTNIEKPVTLLQLKTKVGEVHYNPGLARDPNGNTWISIRSCITNYLEKFGMTHPLGYENFLHIGLLNETLLKVERLKWIKPDKEYDGLQWGIEDVRLFWREDGLHGIGVILPVKEGRLQLRQAEILIDHKAGTYKLLRDLGRPFGHAEKNWSPPQQVNDSFDFVYSPTQVVNKIGDVVGEENDLFIHNGTPLLEIPNEDGYISIAHSVVAVLGERTYATIALKWSAQGALQAHSQFFHFNVGWREQLRETIEFASGVLWSKGKEGEELLVTLGVKDELPGICKIPLSKLKWEPYSDTTWYAWRWDGRPNRVEIRV